MTNEFKKEENFCLNLLQDGGNQALLIISNLDYNRSHKVSVMNVTLLVKSGGVIFTNFD